MAGACLAAGAGPGGARHSFRAGPPSPRPPAPSRGMAWRQRTGTPRRRGSDADQAGRADPSHNGSAADVGPGPVEAGGGHPAAGLLAAHPGDLRALAAAGLGVSPAAQGPSGPGAVDGGRRGEGGVDSQSGLASARRLCHVGVHASAVAETTRLYADRIAGGDRDHRGARRVALAGARPRPRRGPRAWPA